MTNRIPLDNHTSDPIVKAVDDYLGTLTTPRAAFTLDYTTNAASANSMASYASDQRMKLRLAQLYAPAGLLLLFVALCFGSWISWRRHHEPEAPATKPEPDYVDVRERVAGPKEPAGV